MLDGSAGWPSNARHCLRLGAMNDKAVVERAQDSFDVVVLQANLAVSMAKGLGSWEGLRKPFWLDPAAYAYVASPAYLKSKQKTDTGATEERFKRTFVKLAEAYGEPFTRVIAEDRALTPADFELSEDPVIARRILEWQRDALAPPAADVKYFEEPQRQPILLTVPYFPLQRPVGPDTSPRWLDVNFRLVQASLDADVVPSRRLAVGVLVEDALFDQPEIFDEIWDHYLKLPVEHLWLWISDNDEAAEMTASRAERLKRIVMLADSERKHVHQAFGGSFSSFLLSKGLTSVAHGVGYWEHKNWEPLAPGGMPTLRFFYPPLRQRLTFLEADASIPDSIVDPADFFAQICDCETCHTVLEPGLDQFRLYGEVERRSRTDRFGNRIEYDVPLPRAMALSKLHYLQAKALEVRLATGDAFDPGETLRRAIAEYEGRFVSVRPLENWLAAFETAG